MKKHRFAGTPGARRQSGVSLVIVMVLLIAMSLLGVAILRSSAMQERMGANLRDRSLAFQAAEAALRYAQDEVLDGGDWDTTEPDATSCANLGICPPGTKESDVTWRDVPAAAFDATAAGLAAQPEYWIEYLGKGPASKGACDSLPLRELDCKSPMYRITVRSRAEGRADVVLQSTVVRRILDPGA